MPLNPILPIIRFESAHDSAYTQNVETLELNVIAVPIGASLEERYTSIDGYRRNATRLTFEIELDAFSTRARANGHDTSDMLAMIAFFSEARALRIVEITTLARYGNSGIAAVKSMIENRPIRITGISTSLDKEAALESCTLSAESAGLGV